MTEANELSTTLAPVYNFSPLSLEAKHKELTGVCQQVKLIRVTDIESGDRAKAVAKALRDERTAIDDMRKSVTQPLHKVQREINAWFKPLTTMLEKAERTVKDELAAYVVAERNKQRQLSEAATEAHVAGDHESAREAFAVASTANTDAPAGSTVREVWKVDKILNQGLIPLEYQMPNLAKLNALAKSTPADGDPPVVPGVKFHKESVVTVR